MLGRKFVLVTCSLQFDQIPWLQLPFWGLIEVLWRCRYTTQSRDGQISVFIWDYYVLTTLPRFIAENTQSIMTDRDILRSSVTQWKVQLSLIIACTTCKSLRCRLACSPSNKYTKWQLQSLFLCMTHHNLFVLRVSWCYTAGLRLQRQHDSSIVLFEQTNSQSLQYNHWYHPYHNRGIYQMIKHVFP